jgi:subtilisin-like proprotein convertase family protein
MSDHLTPARRRVATLAICLLVASAAAMALGTSSASAAVESYRNSATINLPGNGNASAYPSTINVPSMEGVVTGVTVTFHSFGHSSAQSVHALLVSPDGRTSIVMAGACATNVSTRTFIFHDLAPIEMPNRAPCDRADWRPTDHTLSGFGGFGTAAPPGPYSANFNNFLGSNPSGTWKLFIKGYGGATSGSIAGGWSLTLETRVPDAVVPGPGGVAASPYPLTRAVSGVDGLVTDMNVMLTGIYHQNAADLEMMLMGPRGQYALLLSDSCPGDVRWGNWTFDDEAGLFPSVEQPCESGALKPVGRTDEVVYPNLGFALAGVQAPLSKLDLTDPNGTWKLYVWDDHPFNNQSGLFLDRFTLQLQTRPRAALELGNTTLAVDEGASGELTVMRSAGGAETAAASVQLVATPGTAGADDFGPVTMSVDFAPGETEKKVQIAALADAASDPGETFDVKFGSVSGDARPTGTTAATVTIRDVPPPSGESPAGGGDDPTGGGQPQGGDPDRIAPTISDVALAPRRFAVSRRRTPTVARTRRGTTIRYSLSEPSAVRLRFQRAVAGRRWVEAGVLRRRAAAGANRVGFSGRIGRRALRPGAYRLLVIATDVAGNRGAARPRAFRVVR